MSTKPLTKVLEIHGIWGEVERVVRVHWLPKDVTYLDPAMENIGVKQLIWDTEDDCPLYVGNNPAIASESLYRDKRQVAGGGGAEVFEPYLVHDLNDLKPGTYFVEDISL